MAFSWRGSIHAQGSRKGGEKCVFPPSSKSLEIFPPLFGGLSPPLIFPPYFNFLTIFPYITPPFGILKKVFPPSAEGGRNFFKIFPFFQIFSQKFNFPKASPQKKLKKFSPRKNFPPQFTVSKWFSYPHLWFHQEGFSSPLKNFNNFSPGENLSPPIRPPTCACIPHLTSDFLLKAKLP